MATILQLTNADRNLSLFSRGLKACGLDDKLTEPGPFTVLSPVNLALGRMMSLSYEQLLAPENRAQLLELLSGFIIIGKKMLSDFRDNQKLPTLDGNEVTVTNRDGDIHINGAKILSRDRQGANGVVHLIGNMYTKAEA